MECLEKTCREVCVLCWKAIHSRLNIRLSDFVILRLVATVESGPFGLFLEEAHGVDVLTNEKKISSEGVEIPPTRQSTTHILLIDRESMIDARRQNEQIPFLRPHPHPPILAVPHVKIPRTLQDVPDLLVVVHVFVVEQFDLVLVGRAHGGGRDGDFVAVGVGARLGEVLDLGGG